MKTKIYVVQGSTGEYSDHREWPVAAFKSEEDAKQYVILCTQGVPPSCRDGYLDRSVYPKNPYDPWMQVDYTGVNYNYFEVTLFKGSKNRRKK